MITNKIKEIKVGFNLLLWTTHLVEKDFHLLEKLKATGYDGVEVPIFEGKVEHYQKINSVLNDIGLDYISCSPFRVPIALLESARSNI